LPFRAETLKEHAELELKEDDWIDGRPAPRGIEGGDESPDKGEIEGLLEMAVEMVMRDQLLQGDINKGSEGALFIPHHG
jgi:hypothetical protein